MKCVLLLLVIMRLVSLCDCDNKENNNLKNVLKAVGENRQELEKVLVHFSNHPKDSLKLKAAQFLIKNMPGYYAYAGEYADRYIHAIDAVFKNDYFATRYVLYMLPYQHINIVSQLKIEDDLHYI